MKKLLSILFLLSCFFTNALAQTYDLPGTWGIEYKRVRIDSTLQLPSGPYGPTDTVITTPATRRSGAVIYDNVRNKLRYSTNGSQYNAAVVDSATLADSIAAVSGAKNLQATLDAGNSAVNQTITLQDINRSDSNIIDVNGAGNYIGIRVKNNADTTSTGKIITAAVSVLNYQGKGLIIRTYGTAYTGYSAICNTGDSAMILQSSNGQPIIFEFSVGHGYDAYGFFGGTTKSLNLAPDLIDHMAYSNHLQNLYVNGNTKINNSLTLNDTGRFNAYLYTGILNDGNTPTGPVGLRVVTIKSDSTRLLNFETTGNGDFYIQKRACVGSILNSDTLLGVFNVRKTDLSTYPLAVLDRAGANANYLELWKYLNIRLGYIDPNGNVYMPKYYMTNATRSGTTPDSVVSNVTATGEQIISPLIGYLKKSDSTTYYTSKYRTDTLTTNVYNKIAISTSGPYTANAFTLNTNKLLGRSTAGSGAAEEISIGSGLSLVAGTLSATGGGTGDVVGPTSATDNAITRFDGTTGKLIQNSGGTLDDNSNLFVNNYLANGAATTSAGGTTVLTAASARYQLLSGSSSQTFQLPAANTLTRGPWFVFNNNSSGSLIITNAGGTTLYTVPAGGIVQAGPTDISTSNGAWDIHGFVPGNVTWGTGITGLIFNTALSTTPQIASGASSATTPSFIPQRTASTTGFGGDGTNLFATIAGTAALKISSGSISPNTNDAGALGTSSLMWSDLFLASGGVINFNNGNITLTHSANTLTFNGGTFDLGANALGLTGSLASTGARVLKGWFTDIESTNPPTVGGIPLPTASSTTTFTNKTIANANDTLGGVTTLMGSDATGDIYYRNSLGVLTRLGIGSSTQVLTVSGGLPSWQNASGGGSNPFVYSQTTDATVTNSTTPTDMLGTGVGSKTLTAGIANNIGDHIQIYASGQFILPSSATGNVTFKLLYGSTVIATTPAMDISSATGSFVAGTGNFVLDMSITTRTTGATGTVMPSGQLTLNGVASGSPSFPYPYAVKMDNSGSAVTVDLTASQAITFVVTFSTAQSGKTCSGKDSYISYYSHP